MKQKKSVKFFLLIFIISLLPFLPSCAPPQKETKPQKEAQRKEKREKTKNETPTSIEKLTSRLNEVPFIYAAKSNRVGSVSLIDSQNDSATSIFSLPEKITVVEMKPDGSELYAASPESNKIFIINLKTNKIVKVVKAEGEPSSIAFLPDGSRAYVTHHASNYISIIDTGKREIVERIQVGKHPAAIAITFDGKKAYIGHSLYVNLKKMKKTKIRGVEVPLGMPEFSEGPKIISVIDLRKNKVIQEIPLEGYCDGIAVRPDDAIIYSTVSSIDVSGIMRGKGEKGLKDSLTVIETSTNKVIKKIEFDQGSGPKAVAFTPDGDKAYAICGGSDNAYIVEAKKHKLLRKMPLGLGG